MKNGRFYVDYPSPLGVIRLAGDGESLTGLWFAGQRYFAATLKDGAKAADLPVFQQAEQWLKAYFAGERPEIAFPLSPAGTLFQQAVWQLLREIPRGETRTYGELAGLLTRRSGRKTSPRAVGAAVGRNPISILIPCHRVIGANGSLTGYAGGLERKAWLLGLERGE